MSRMEFLSVLRSRLSCLPPEEQDAALRYYEEYFEEAEDEEGAAEHLGSPDRIADKILQDYGQLAPRTRAAGPQAEPSASAGPKDGEKQAPKAEGPAQPGADSAPQSGGPAAQAQGRGQKFYHSAWFWVAFAFSLPITLPIALALAGAAIAIAAALFAVVVALFAVALGLSLGFGIGGLIMFFYSFLALGDFAPAGVLMMGTGLALMGLGLLSGLGFYGLIASVARCFRRSPKKAKGGNPQ